MARHGHFPSLDSAVSFVSERLLTDGLSFKPAYTVRGGRDLQGYPGGTDKVGNWVDKQFQLDTFGEVLELYAAASCDRLDVGHWNAIEVAASAIESRWREPDAGIWEIDPQRWAH